MVKQVKYLPDNWILMLVKKGEKKYHRILCSGYGGYMSGDWWRLSSNIDVNSVDNNDETFTCTTKSGAVYVLPANLYSCSGIMSQQICRITNAMTDSDEAFNYTTLTKENALALLKAAAS